MSGTITDVRLRMQVTDEMISNGIGMKLKQDAVAYWKMDELTGTRRDATGKGNDATGNVFVSSVPGKIGNAVQFTPSLVEANGSYISVPSPNYNLPIGTGSFFMWGWFYLNSVFDPSTFTDGWNIYDRTIDAASVPEGNIWLTSSHGVAALQISWGGNIPVFAADTNEDGDLVSGVPYFFVAGVDRTLNKGFVRLNNGVMRYGIEPPSPPVSPADSGITTVVGGFPDYAPATLDGWLDEMGLIIGRVPTSSELDYLWNDGNGRSLFP